MQSSLQRLDATLADSDAPIILEFHANHCSPCVTQEELLAHASVHPSFPIKVVSINVDEAPDVAERYTIKSVPSVLVLDRGEVLARFTGLIDPGSVIAAIEAA